MKQVAVARASGQGEAGEWDVIKRACDFKKCAAFHVQQPHFVVECLDKRFDGSSHG